MSNRSAEQIATRQVAGPRLSGLDDSVGDAGAVDEVQGTERDERAQPRHGLRSLPRILAIRRGGKPGRSVPAEQHDVNAAGAVGADQYIPCARAASALGKRDVPRYLVAGPGRDRETSAAVAAAQPVDAQVAPGHVDLLG